jgi:hypothetical protein
MPLVSAKCTSCGANLEVDNAKDAAICPYCNTPYVVEKAINNYCISNNITADTVNIYGGNSVDFVIRAGVLEKYNGASADVIIPDTVSKIGKEAFEGCIGLRSVSIPESVTEIGESAFANCRSLTNVSFPESLTEIGIKAFAYCKSLTSIDLPSNITETGVLAFCNCSALNKVTISKNVSVISAGAFSYCESLASIDLHDGITDIQHGAFEYCSALQSITIPKNVKEIGPLAFGGCINLKSVTFPDGIKIIWNAAFRDCKALKSIYLPNSIEKIYLIAFAGCTSLENVTLPKHVEIGNNAFQGTPYQKNKSGCYIATAVYGSYDCPQVWTLRRFRDNTLAETWYGRAFIRTYYAISPTFVKWFGHTEWFKAMWKGSLDRMVAELNADGVENTPYEDKVW